MANQFTQTAGAANVSWAGSRSTTSLGASIEELRGRYSVADTTQADEASLLGVGSQLRVGSVFVEHSHDIGRLTTTLGARAALAGERAFFEPRAAFALSLFNGIGLSGAFARTHQYTQSLYNDESVVDALASLEVPVVAGAAGVPIAASTSGSLQLDVPLGSATLISASTFARIFDALALAGPSGGDPFAAHAFTAGHGEAYGGSIGVRERVGRLEMQGLYSMSSVSREWGGEREYRPTFAPSNNLLISAGYQVGENTLLRASGFMSAIRSTSPLFGAVAWEWQDALASQRQVSGSPQYSPAALGMRRLAPYVRIDLGVRHTFAFGRSFRASVYANVDNLLDRRNAAGLIEDTSETGIRALRMMPRSLSFGLSLRF
jgi:hypothetical protein